MIFSLHFFLELFEYLNYCKNLIRSKALRCPNGRNRQAYCIADTASALCETMAHAFTLKFSKVTAGNIPSDYVAKGEFFFSFLELFQQGRVLSNQ
jgi:hypothetical protein